MNLADQIRARLGNRSPFDDVSARTAALLAVVAKCEQMRAESGERGVGRFIADEFEQTIARGLGILS